ncbi:hypothetical protein C2G38_2178804 [Gigaspora rosea]|uniref:Helicase C-terminal domain-containing protein n=1 Tax=Gigaspora rosea TaxID=44941 RepID=A0A397VF64_9GLOM|nr:hypothetical protein C2G38_2178804 [Gigaspora rosea]
MGVHARHVRIIIHTTFPLSPTNFVQEVGRAGRDEQLAESLVLYARADIRELLMIVSGKIEKWSEDPEISECDVCDNCIKCVTDGIIWHDIITFGRDDIADVFMKANNKNAHEKNLTSLWTNESDDMNNDTINTLIQTKSMCLHAIDRLCLEEILVQRVKIKPMRPGSLALVYTSNIFEIASNARQKIGEKS